MECQKSGPVYFILRSDMNIQDKNVERIVEKINIYKVIKYICIKYTYICISNII